MPHTRPQTLAKIKIPGECGSLPVKCRIVNDVEQRLRISLQAYNRASPCK